MQNIETILKEAIKEHKMDVPIEAWPYIAAGIRNRKRRKIIWFFLSVSIMLTFSVSSLLLNNTKNKTADKKSNEFLLVEKNKISINEETPNNKTKKITPLLPENIKSIVLTRSEKKYDVTKAIVSPSIKSFIKNDKVGTTSEVVTQTELNDEEKLFDKRVTFKKIKNQSKLKMPDYIYSRIQTFINDDSLKATNELVQIETKVTNNTENTFLSTKKADSIIFTAKTNINIKKNTDGVVEEIDKSKAFSAKIKKEKKWGRYLELSSGVLYVKSNNIFKSENKTIDNNRLQYTSPVGQAFINNINAPNYQKGKEISLSILFKKENKKLQPIFGININLGSFKARVYDASNALVDATTLRIDSIQSGNSAYASISSIGTKQTNIKNNYVQIGFAVGYNIPLYSLKNGSKFLLQAQVIPTFNLSQNIQWHDNLSGRYFTSQKLNSDFRINQSTALLFQANIKNRSFLLGPYFNFNYLKFNKSVENVSNIYTQSIGTKIQIKFKK